MLVCILLFFSVLTNVSGKLEYNEVVGTRNYVLENCISNLNLSVGEKLIMTLLNKYNEVSVITELGINLKNHHNPFKSSIESDGIILLFNKNQYLKIKKTNQICYEFIWNWSKPIEDCIRYGNASWYGGSEFGNQVWPIQKQIIVDVPFITSAQNSMGVLEPVWMNSDGLLLFVDHNVPLFINSNNHRENSLCLISNSVYPYYTNRSNTKLNYTLCQLENARKAREYAIKLGIIAKPAGLPDTRMIKYPIWSTWVQFKTNVNQTAVLKLAEEIVAYGFNNSQIEIDDNWETCYGSMTFNEERFPNVKSLSNRLKKLGFRITLWRHPFINVGCSNYSILYKENFFVKNGDGSYITKWWNGYGSLFDFSNKTVENWFIEKHRELLEESGIDGFKFDAGESSYMPRDSILSSNPNYYPNSFTSAYVDTVSNFGRMTETRVGYGTQNYPLFVRMLDKNSRWDYNAGLPTLITTCLLMNLIGYPWVLPDMVGGNAYGDDISEELFIRWLQANTFMPVIQFSYVPWNFNKEVIELTKKFTSLHYQYFDKIFEAMNKTREDGSPVNAPIWWIDPKDTIAQSIYNEYLLGEDILVAPVLVQGAVERDVYLPKGLWKDGNMQEITYVGPIWLKNYPADLSILPYFIKIS